MLELSVFDILKLAISSEVKWLKHKTDSSVSFSMKMKTMGLHGHSDEQLRSS